MALRSINLGKETFDLEGKTIPLGRMIPNPEQPRLGPKFDTRLMESIKDNGGIVVPILVEPLPPKERERFMRLFTKNYPDFNGFLKEPEYLIVDGERRWVNTARIVKEDPEFKSDLPIDILPRSLSEKERVLMWVHLHRTRKDWKAKEKESTAMQLYRLVGDAAIAAHALGVTEGAFLKLIEVYKLSERMDKKVGPTSISYARETLNLNRRLRTDDVVNAIVDKTNEGLITTPVAIREMRKILPDPTAREEFLKPDGTIDSALKYVETEGAITPKASLKNNLIEFRRVVTKYPWTELHALKGDKELAKEIDHCIDTLKQIKESVS